MFRTIIALLICLVVAVIIGAFQILGLTGDMIMDIIEAANPIDALKYQGALLFGVLLFPYTFALSGVYSPLVALGVAGFISGLISKSGVRMFFVSIIALVLFFLAYYTLTLAMAIDPAELWDQAQLIYLDLGASFGLIFIPGIIGASLTAEEY